MEKSSRDKNTYKVLLVRLVILGLLVWVSYAIVRANSGSIWNGVGAIYNYVKYFFFFILFVAVLIIDGISFGKDKRILHFLPTVVGVTFLGVILVLLININSIENAKTTFSVRTIEGEEPFYEIDFKEGGVFKFIAHSELGPTHTYGEYEMEDSIIRVFNFECSDCDFSNDWTFKGDTLHIDGIKMIVDNE